MANHQQTHFGAKAEQQKSIFPFRMFIIIELNCIIVKKNSLRFFECDAMLLIIFGGFVGLPFKT